MSQDNYRHSHTSKNDLGNSTPVRLFFASALGWLMLSSVLGLILSIKLYRPTFMSGCEWFHDGRIEILQHNIFTYGWITNAIFGLNLWIMSALARFEFKDSWLAVGVDGQGGYSLLHSDSVEFFLVISMPTHFEKCPRILLQHSF
jgi:cbb3-type cytochrome oxidase subunit 1